MEKENDLPDCCRPVKKPENKKGIWWGIVYGILPHTFCIAFIVLSVFGATAGAAFFGKVLAMPLFFPALIALSFVFATLSAFIYLKKNGRCSRRGISASKKYLAVLYGTTFAVGLIMAYVVFPLAINATAKPAAQNVATATGSLTLKVAIPCPGHASLIIGELQKLNGVAKVDFTIPDVFTVSYDQDKINPSQIMSLEIFKTYNATIQ